MSFLLRAICKKSEKSDFYQICSHQKKKKATYKKWDGKAMWNKLKSLREQQTE